MIKSILNKIKSVRKNSIKLAILFFLIFSTSIYTSYAQAPRDDDFELRTPVQILDVSQSSFDIFPGQSSYLVLTVINLTNNDALVNMEISDATGLFDNKQITNDISQDVEFKFDDKFWIPSNSVLRIPVSFTVSDNTNLTLIQNAIKLSTISDNSQFNLSVLQPLKINIENNSIYASVAEASISNPKLKLIVLILLTALIIILTISKKIPHKEKLFLILLILSIYPIWILSTTDNPLKEIALNLRTNTLENLDTTAPNESEEDIASLFNEYEFKIADTGDYIELYGTTPGNHEIPVLLNETQLILTYDITETDSIVISGDVDINQASEDVEIQIDNTSNNEELATEDIDIDIDSVEMVIIDSTPIVEEPSTYIYNSIENQDFGIQVPILKDGTSLYDGLEIRALAFLTPQNIKRNLIRKYVAKALKMSDDGEIRNELLKTCFILKKQAFDVDDKVLFQNIVLRLLKNEDVSYEEIQAYADLVFDDAEQILHESGSNLCKDFEDAHNAVVESMRKGGLLPRPEEKEITAATIDVMVVTQTISTPNVDIVVPSAPSNEAASIATTIEAPTQPIKQPETQTIKLDSTNDDVRTLTLFDLTDTSELKDENSSNDDIKTNDNNGKVIELDLTKSDLVEISIPRRIQLPTLSREQKAYTTRNNMGDFKIQTFKDQDKWRGFFTFEVIELNDGTPLDNMWLEVGGQKLFPEKSMNKQNQFLNFQLSDKLFNQNTAGEYNFNPYIWIHVPAKASPGEYNADISFTLIQ